MEENNSRRAMMKTLKITRRVIEGYEKEGLIQAEGRDENGRLYYGKGTLQRAAFIRFCQKMGLTLKDIHEFIDWDAHRVKAVLKKQKVFKEKKADEERRELEILERLLEENDPRNSEIIFEIVKEEER